METHCDLEHRFDRLADRRSCLVVGAISRVTVSDAAQLIEAAWQARREERHGDAERDLVQAIALARETHLRKG
jgi:hypothetical protein